MAIQFNCPSCEAMIRVPDTASGKKGTCPRCGEKLLVPDLATAAGATPPPTNVSSSPFPSGSERVSLPPLDFQSGPAVPGNVRTGGASAPSAGLPVFDSPAPAAPLGFGLPPLAESGVGAAGVGTMGGLNRKQLAKKKANPAALLIPIICILGVIGFLGWYTQKSEPKMEGDLTAQAVRDLEVTPALIPGNISGLPTEDLNEVLSRLRATPSRWNSTSSKITLTGATTGVEVTIHPGTANHFVRVQPTKNPVFMKFITEHLAELERPRQASITQHAPKLFADWKAQFANDDPLSDPKLYRDSVALPALVTGVGYHLEAASNGHTYPCVYEDAAGYVYFLLPNATKSFRLQGRKLTGGLTLPANFNVKLSGTIEAKATRKKVPEAEIEEPQAEPEYEGLNPNLYKQDIEEKRRANKKKKSTGTGFKQPSGSAMPENDMSEMEMNSSNPAMKSKSAMSSPGMMMEGDDEMMDDEMPAKSKPKKRPGLMPKDEMMESGDEMSEEMMEQPKRPKPIKTPN